MHLISFVAEVEDQALKTVNYFRKLHNAKPLEPSPELNRAALNYAKQLLAEGKVKNSDASSGESIALKCSGEITVADAIKKW